MRERRGMQRRILVVEDEALTRSLVAEALRREDFEVRACADAAEAAEEFRAFDPDAVVCDLDLGAGANGLALLSALTAANPHIGVVLLSNYTVPAAQRSSALDGAVHLHKRAVIDVDELVDAVDAALSGTEGENAPSEDGKLAGLTPTQLEVLSLVAAGLSNAQIATRRGRSVRAIEQLNRRIFRLLGIPSDPAVNQRVVATRIYLAEAGFSDRPAP